MLRVWAAFDALYLAYYLARMITVGKVPFVSTLKGAQAVSNSFGSALPLAVSALSVGLILSMFWSAYGLWRARRFGQLLVYGQLPLRLLLAMPSVFFIPWLLQSFSRRQGAVAFIVLVIGTEGWKLVTVNRAYRHHDYPLKPRPDRGAA